jgi:hypothetical protein
MLLLCEARRRRRVRADEAPHASLHMSDGHFLTKTLHTVEKDSLYCVVGAIVLAQRLQQCPQSRC